MFPLELLQEKATIRPCGPCQACCTAVGVEEIGKNPWQRCEHQCESGCDVYGSHPEECKTYFCLYQNGALRGGEEMRPDNLGIIFDFRQSTMVNTPVICAWEIIPSAADKHEGLMTDIIKQVNVIIVVKTPDEKRIRLIASEENLEKIRQANIGRIMGIKEAKESMPAQVL